ncbi:MAG: GtrA family protein [Proteobacteria bacterium]|nr:GtrA family protein [Pseudomonadota bacterium]
MLNSVSRLIKTVSRGQGNKGWAVQFFQHLVTGVIATAAHYAVMLIILSWQHWPIVATSLGFIVGAITRFVFSYYHIFEPESHVTGALLRFLVLLGIQMAVNAGLLALLLTTNLSVWPAQIITTVLLTVVNFIMAKYWVFK